MGSKKTFQQDAYHPLFTSSSPPDRDPPGQRTPRQRPPGRKMGLETDPSEGTWDQAAGQEVTSYRDPCEHND